MTQKGGPAVPSKEEFAAMTPEQQAAQKKKAMMQNLNLTPKEKAAKEAMEKENMGDKPKKMNMGGMANLSPQEIKGIIYYIDGTNNVYDTDDILGETINPKINKL